MTFEEEYAQALADLHYEVCRHDLEYADNYRAYRVHDRAGIHKFRQREKKGCCGFFTGHTTINGNKWIIACNYGH